MVLFSCLALAKPTVLLSLIVPMKTHAFEIVPKTLAFCAGADYLSFAASSPPSTASGETSRLHHQLPSLRKLLRPGYDPTTLT
jgi:hypothetical protein